MNDDEMYLGLTRLDLSTLHDRMEEIRGSWNGKESGILEGRCQIAAEVQECIEPLKTLLDELMQTYG